MPLTLTDIPDGATVFLDANVFVYHFAPHPVFSAPVSNSWNDVAARNW